MPRRRVRPTLITDAELSPEEQLRRREVRYVLMMGIRIVCLLVAGLLVSLRAPLLWVWVPLCLVGMILVPWLAVLLANDTSPRSSRRPRPDQRARSADPAPVEPKVVGPAPRVIDPD